MFLIFVRLVPVVSMHEVRKLVDEEKLMTAWLLAEFADSQRIVDAAGERVPPGFGCSMRSRRFRSKACTNSSMCALMPHPPRHVHRRHDSGGARLRPGILFGGYQLSLQ